MGLPALPPDDCLPGVYARLVTYKRIASAADRTELTQAFRRIRDSDVLGRLHAPVKHSHDLYPIRQLPAKSKENDVTAPRIAV